MPGEKESSSGDESAWFFHDGHLDTNKYCKQDRHAQLIMEKPRTFPTRRTLFFAGHVGKPFNRAKSRKIEGPSNTPTMEGYKVSAFLFP